ncbi:M48 family metallopeptidase [Candidatus Omnitrophota bacterium]
MEKINITKIIRSKRKTLALEVAHDASLIVRAPEMVSNEYIEKLVHKKRFWIQDRQKAILEKNTKIAPKEFVNGEGFLYLGNTYRLSIVNDNPLPLTFDKEFRLLRGCLPNARQKFIDWYKKEAYEKIKQRLDWYSATSGLKYNKVNITSAMKRWGSCNAKGDLFFSWRLIMAPWKVIDYVVIHELSHVVVKNHSTNFWNKVKVMLPDYEKSRKWLKENEHLLRI